MESTIQTIVIAAIPVIFAITFHEAAHAYAARHFGDPTAWAAGRMTLNPISHIDPIGTVLLPLGIMLLSSGSMLFGYAKPVPVNFGRLRNPKRDMLWVAAAGPAANLIMLFGWTALFNLSWVVPFGMYEQAIVQMCKYGISINLVLMVLNLLPLPPLDGGRIAVSLLPNNLAVQFAKIEPFGFPILLVLLFTGVLSTILQPIMGVVFSVVQFFFKLF